MEQRLRNRSQDAEDVIQRRLDTASREIENYEKYDYILVNDRLEESVETLKAICSPNGSAARGTNKRPPTMPTDAPKPNVAA